MDFTIFNQTELEEMFQAMIEHMPEEIRQTAINEFGSVEQWKQHYLEVTSSEKMQKNYAKMVEWYGGKEAYLSVVKNPVSKEVAESYNKKIETILQKLYDKRDCPVDSFEVKEIVGEYGFAMKQFSQIKDERELMLANARFYRKEPSRSNLDQKYGEGAAEFFARAIEAFYSES